MASDVFAGDVVAGRIILKPLRIKKGCKQILTIRFNCATETPYSDVDFAIYAIRRHDIYMELICTHETNTLCLLKKITASKYSLYIRFIDVCLIHVVAHLLCCRSLPGDKSH